MTEATTKQSLELLFKPRNVVIYEAKEKLGYFIGGFRYHDLVKKIISIYPFIFQI